MTDFILGIDIGGVNTKFGLVDQKGNLSKEGVFPTKSHEPIETFLANLKSNLSTLISAESVIGLAVCAPNVNYYNSTLPDVVNFDWGKDVPLKELIVAIFDLPLVLINDASASALGEMAFGGAKNMKDFVVFTLGAGLGSGFVVNGEIVFGHSGMAGEIGHVSVNPNGRYCACGRRGCLETYVSEIGIKKTVF